MATLLALLLAPRVVPGAAVAHAASDPVLASFVETYGDPPAATFGRVRIPAIGVDAPVGAREVGADGSMPMPLGPTDVAWYDFTAVPGYGGEPGRGANAVFSGHVDYVARVPWAGVRYAGPGVFADLGRVEPGAVIEVERDGVTLEYVVSWTRRVPADDDSWGGLLAARVPLDSVTVFTCGGDFDARRLEYSHRIVVRAERAQGAGNQLPQTWGDYTAGVAGTDSPAALARAQQFPVHAIWKLDPVNGDHLFWAPGVPAFVDTLSGQLAPDDYVIMRIR